MMNVMGIQINYQENPIGVEEIRQIGWKLEADTRNVLQKSYQLQVSKEEDFASLVYDSGVVQSENSAHVTIPDAALLLTSVTRYFVRVQVTANSGETSAWKQSDFVTALLCPDEWQAKFITIETDADKGDTHSSYLKKQVPLQGVVKSAYVLSSALGVYHFYINGQKVGNDELAPGWTSYNKHLLYQMHDVSGLLHGGENVLTGFINAGWYKGKMGFSSIKNHYGSRAAFACQLHVEYEDGTTALWTTDESWRGIFGPVVFSEIYDGEIYDARQEVSDCNSAQDVNQWQAAQAVSFDTSVLKAQSGSKVCVVEKLPVQQIITTPQGDTVLDFGQNLTGWIEFCVQGSAGDRVEINCFEMLDSNGNVYLDNLRSAKQTLTYFCKDTARVICRPYFTFQGFQYAKIAAYPGSIKPENFTACVVHSDMRSTGSFECSNPDINQLQHNILWGMKGNFLDVPTDCPQRDERLGWTGDAQIFCRTASYLMDTYTFFTKWLRDLAADQTPEGGVPHVVPDILIGKSQGDRLMKDGDHSAAAWADAAVIVPWTLYLTYGDTAVIKEQYDSMKAWVAFMQQHSVDSIWNFNLQFGDWVALDAEEGSYFGATPNDLTCTAYYAYSTGLLAKMADVIGRTQDAEHYRALYNEVLASYCRHFFDETGHLTAQTQTAQIITLYFGLLDEKNRQNVVDDLLRLLAKEDGHLVTGFVGTPYFCHALSQNGHTKEAYELLLKEDFPSWLYQVRQGATTIWEHWDGLKPDGSMWSPDMNSFNHYAYGAIGEWLYRAVGGIECDEAQPGYKHIVIAPHIGGGLDFAKASYESMYGMISTEWHRQEQSITLKVHVPCNTAASITLLQADKVLDADGLEFSENSDGFTAKTGSGDFKVRYTLKA